MSWEDAKVGRERAWLRALRSSAASPISPCLFDCLGGRVYGRSNRRGAAWTLGSWRCRCWWFLYPSCWAGRSTYNRGNAIEVDTENYETTFTGNLELLVDCINKPAISIGWSGSGPAHVLTSSDEIFTADTTFGQSGNSTSTAHTRVTRAGNYAFVLVPAGTGTVPIELSAQARVDSIGQTNFAMGIYIERTSGLTDISDLPDSIGSPIMTFAGQGGFIGNWITPTILNLPRSASGQNIYRFSLRGRTTNATGQVGSWRMTIKLL